MRRPLAPTLGLLALAGAACAADPWLKPEFSFGGFVEAIADVGNDSVPNDATDSIDDDRWFADFLAMGGVSMDVRFDDHVGARLDLWLNPWGHSYADPQFRD